MTAGSDSEPDLREPERRVRPGDRDVRARDEPRAAAERVAVHDADDRRRARVDRLQHPVQAHRVLDVLLVREVDRGALPLDVGARAEARPLSGEDDRARVVDVRERFGELGDERGVERVAALWPRERHPQDAAVPFDAQGPHAPKPYGFAVVGKRFTVELERVGKTATMFRVPFDLEEAFGRARPPVQVTIRGHTWRTTPGVYGGVGHIVVNRDVKRATGVDAPDRVQVEMALDTEPRTVQVPADLRSALAGDSEAKAAFAKLSYTHRREYVEWIEEAKRPETRARRIAGTVERVRAGLPQR